MIRLTDILKEATEPELKKGDLVKAKYRGQSVKFRILKGPIPRSRAEVTFDIEFIGTKPKAFGSTLWYDKGMFGSPKYYVPGGGEVFIK